MNVVLIGMKGSGKTTLGAALARRWGCAFHDVDTLIEAMYACEAGRRKPVREIFIERGPQGFARLESHVVCELYLKLDQPGTRAVVALGGRTACNRTIRELLAGIGTLVYLRATPEVLFERVRAAGLPPFLDEEDPRAAFHAVYDERAPQFESAAQITLDVDGLGVETALEALAKRLEEYDHAG